MEIRDMEAKDNEDIERMLTKAASLEKSIIAIVDDACIRGEKFYSELTLWLKNCGIFEHKYEKTHVVREKRLRRKTEKPRNLFSKAEIEIERICDSINATVDRGKDYIDKVTPALRYFDKIESLVQEGKLEISNLKKNRKKEIEELKKILKQNKNLIDLLKERKVGEESYEEKKAE